jgi:hypothetical protein
MKPVDAREARRAALRKGFAEQGGDHHYLHFYYAGKKTSWRIKISHGATEYAPSHIRKDARVCGEMSPDDLRKVATCDHDGAWVVAQYLAHLTKQRP